jgi:cobalamin biosynthesis Co2+ chelatase CbiK
VPACFSRVTGVDHSKQFLQTFKHVVLLRVRYGIFLPHTTTSSTIVQSLHDSIPPNKTTTLTVVFCTGGDERNFDAYCVSTRFTTKSTSEHIIASLLVFLVAHFLAITIAKKETEKED